MTPQLTDRIAAFKATLKTGQRKPPVFVLVNKPPQPKPWQGETVDYSQRVLITGTKCLSGQLSLFDT